MIRILGIGIGTMDIYRHQGRMYPGGNEYNIAWHAQEQGGQGAFMGVFADDKVGALLYQVLEEKGVDLSFSRHEKGSSGYCLVDLEEGERVFLDWNKEGVTDLHPFQLNQKELQYAAMADVVCTSHYARVTPDNVRKLHAAGARVCYDFCDFLTDEDMDTIVPYIDIAFFSASHMTVEEMQELQKMVIHYGCTLAIATRGSEGAWAYDGEQFRHAGIVKTEVADTIGAGDSFISTFLLNYLLRETDESLIINDKIYDSLSEAAKYAAGVISMNGSLGIGYDVDTDRLHEIIHLKEGKV